MIVLAPPNVTVVLSKNDSAKTSKFNNNWTIIQFSLQKRNQNYDGILSDCS